MANVIISNAVDTFLQSNNVGEMQTNLDLSTYLASPPAIGGATAASGRFTELRIGTPTKPPLIIGNYNDVTGTGGDNATIWATASPTISNYIFTATDTTTFFNSAENLSFRTDGLERLFIDDNSIKPLVPFRPLTDSTSAIQFQNAVGNETTASIDTTNRVFKAWTFVAGNSAPAALSDQHFYVTRSSGDPTQVYVRDGNFLAQIRGGGNATDAGIRITNGNSLSTWMEINGTDVEIVPPLTLTDGKIRPDNDSASAIQFQNAGGTENILTINTSENKVETQTPLSNDSSNTIATTEYVQSFQRDTAFLGVRSTAANVDSGETTSIGAITEISDPGNNYNGSNTYTAPTDGLYSFNIQVTATPQSGTFSRIVIDINGVKTFDLAGLSSNQFSTSNSIILSLSQGNIVVPSFYFVTSGGAITTISRITFSGYKLCNN